MTDEEREQYIETMLDEGFDRRTAELKLLVHELFILHPGTRLGVEPAEAAKEFEEAGDILGVS
jgi:hypothetical protein